MIMERSLMVVALALLLQLDCPGSEEERPAKDAGAPAEAAKSEQPKGYKAGDSVGLKAETRIRDLSNFCVNADGNFLACDAAGSSIKVISPEDKLVATWKLKFSPQAICARADGTVFVGGWGHLARLDSSGKMKKSVKGKGAKNSVSGIAATDKYVFVVLRASTGFVVYRFNHDFEEPKKILSNLRGCCGQLDVAAGKGVIYLAENARHRVLKVDPEGKVLKSWGKRDRKGLEGFTGCCNPMNVCVGPEGNVYTSESGPGRVKCYTPEGKYLRWIGDVSISGGCIRVSVATNSDASRVYVLDTKNNTIRSLVAVSQ